MAQDWFDQIAAPVSAQPAREDPIIKRGGPDPYQVAKDQRSMGLEEARFGMSQRDQAIQEEAARRSRLEWEATHNPDGSLKPKPSADDGDAKARVGRLNALIDQINRVQELYNQDIAPEPLGVLSSIGDYMPTDANARFDTAGTQLAEKGLGAFRIPGTGTITDRDAAMFERANMPTASTRDVAIEEQLRGMKSRIDEEFKSLGIAPPQWEGTPQESDNQAAIPGAVGADGVGVSRNLNEIEGGNGGAAMGFETGATRYEDDPQLAGVISQYQSRLGRGDSADQIIAYLRDAGVSNPGVFNTVRQQVDFRRQNPNVPIGNYNVAALDDRSIPQSVIRQVTNAVADSPVGVGIMNAGDAVTGFNLDSMTANPAATRAGMDQVNRENPTSALVGQMAGGAAAALTGEGLLARAGVTGARAGIGADVGYGALAGAGASDDNRMMGAGIGALSGFAGNRVGAGLTNTIGRATGGVSSPSVNALAPNTPLTIGQAVGQSGPVGEFVKGVEDRLSGLPIVGDAIGARRQAGVEAFNTNAFDRALKPIGASVNGAMGEDAVQVAQQAVSDAYTRALSGKAVGPDQPFANQMSRAVTDVMKLPRIGPEMADNVKVILEPYMQGGQLTGDAMQQISRELQWLKASYRNDALASRIGRTIDEVEDSVFGLFRRQAPEVLPAYNKAKAAARRLYIIEDAVLKAKNQGGVFTPAQLGNADKSGMSRYGGKRGAAAGKSPFHDFQRAAQDVLPNRVPDSGTAGRAVTALALPIAGGSAGAGIGAATGDTSAGAQGGLTLGALLTAAYSRAGQRALVGAATRRSAGARQAGRAISNAAPRIGTITGGAASTLPSQ